MSHQTSGGEKSPCVPNQAVKIIHKTPGSAMRDDGKTPRRMALEGTTITWDTRSGLNPYRQTCLGMRERGGPACFQAHRAPPWSNQVVPRLIGICMTASGWNQSVDPSQIQIHLSSTKAGNNTSATLGLSNDPHIAWPFMASCLAMTLTPELSAINGAANGNQWDLAGQLAPIGSRAIGL